MIFVEMTTCSLFERLDSKIREHSPRSNSVRTVKEKQYFDLHAGCLNRGMAFRLTHDVSGPAECAERLNNKNYDNYRKWTHMDRFGLRGRPFEAHSHFQSIANPPRPQIPPENSKYRHVPKNPGIRRGRRQWAEPL